LGRSPKPFEKTTESMKKRLNKCSIGKENFKQQNLEQLKETRARKRAAKETDDINTWGCDRLRNECRTRGIKGFSNKSRDELLELLSG